MPAGLFRERRGVHVVLQDQPRPERLTQPGEDRRAAQASQPAGQRHGSPPRVVDTRTADHGLGDGAPGHPGVCAQRVRQADQLSHPAAHARRPGPRRVLRADLAGQVGQRTAQVVVPDVQPQHEARIRPDLVEQGGAPGQARALPGDPDQPRALDVGQRLRDRGLGEPGDAGEIGPRARPDLADVAEQQLLVQSPDELRPGRLAIELTGWGRQAEELGVSRIGAWGLGDAGGTR